MTAHNEAVKEDIANIVIMPGDPLRAKYIAENFLTDYKLVNKVRNIYAFTGYYNNTRVTIMASGMGMPSMGIYSYELFKFYDVDYIVRVGSCGAYKEGLNLFDVILADEAYSDSNYGLIQNGDTSDVKYPSTKLNDIIYSTDSSIKKGRIYSSDVFYKDKQEDSIRETCLAVEMESFALFHNASILGKHAACILTVSDSFVTHEETTPEQREKSFNHMIKLALDSIERI